MTVGIQYLSLLHDAYENKFGSIANFIEFRHPTKDPAIPAEMDILFFLPEDGPNDDNVTMVATAGMSSRPLTGSAYPRIEIAYEFNGDCPLEKQRTIAKKLAELAVDPFLYGKIFTPETIIEGLNIEPFFNMAYALLVHWDVLAEVFLSGINPPPLLLRIVPLYESETKVIDELRTKPGISRLRDRGLVFEDTERESVV